MFSYFQFKLLIPHDGCHSLHDEVDNHPPPNKPSNLVNLISLSKGKVWYPSESTRDLYQHIPPIYGLYNGFMGQYGVMFWEQLLVPSHSMIMGERDLCFSSNHQSWKDPCLVGGFNPFEKYARQNGSFPQIGMKIKNL